MEAYLDNSATTRCSKAATDKMVELLTMDFGNPSSLHLKGVAAENEITNAKKKIAKTLKVQDKEIVFTSGGTESNNLAIIGSAMANKRAGMHIITTAIEHASVSSTMAFLKEQGFEITYLSVDNKGHISLDELRDSIREDTILVSIMQVNNEMGAVEPIEEIGKIIKSAGHPILFHVDAIQSYGKMVIRPSKLNVDLLSVSGHKLHGPKGTGFIYIKDKTKIKPIIYGGGQQKGMRSGTENVPGFAALGIACEEIYDNFDEKLNHLLKIKELFIQRVSAIEGITVNSGLGEGSAPHIVSISIEGVRAEVILHALEDKNIYVSAGSACSSNKPAISATLKAIGVKPELLDSTIRCSFSVHTTEEEIIYATDVMAEIIPMLQKYTRK